MTTDTSFTEELLEMLSLSETISDEQKKSYVNRIMKGEFTEEMQQELATIFENEMRRLDGKIAQMGEEVTITKAKYEKEWLKIEPEMKKIVQAQEEESAQAVADFSANCNKAEREAESSVEGAVNESEQTEADAIRENLKKPGGEE